MAKTVRDGQSVHVCDRCDKIVITGAGAKEQIVCEGGKVIRMVYRGALRVFCSIECKNMYMNRIKQ